MRVMLKIEDCYQIFDCIDIVSGNNFDLVLHLPNETNIIVQDIKDTDLYLKKLMIDGFIDLSRHYSYYYQAPEVNVEYTNEDGTEREIEPKDELDILFRS